MRLVITNYLKLFFIVFFLLLFINVQNLGLNKRKGTGEEISKACDFFLKIYTCIFYHCILPISKCVSWNCMDRFDAQYCDHQWNVIVIVAVSSPLHTLVVDASICDTIKGNESLVENVNFYFLTPLSQKFKMLHFDANPITIGYRVTELRRICQC